MDKEVSIRDAELVEIKPEVSESLPSYPTKEQIAEYKEFLANYDEFINSVLDEKVDFGIIPGVEKPSLFKPGAEKLEKLMFLTHEKICIEKIVTDEFISYTYQTKVYDKAGNLKATCEGNCNSKEKKYRSTTVYEKDATEEQKKNGTRIEKSGKYGKFFVIQIEKPDYYDLQNTIMKMAQKRSYVGAILEATNSSGRFTQDVEDMDISKGNTTKAVDLTVPARVDDDIPTITEEDIEAGKSQDEQIRQVHIMNIDKLLSVLKKDREWLKKKKIDLDTLSISGLENVYNQLNLLPIKK